MSKLSLILKEVKEEYDRASNSNAKFNSAHEGFAIIMEEYEELKDEVFKKKDDRSYDAMEHEAVQLAAMAIRFIHDVIYW